MKITEFNPEVFFSREDITKVSNQDLEFLKKKASNNERRRVRLCTHKNLQDKVHEMLIIHGKDAYVRPHKHIDKSESLHVIEGKAYAIIFEESGKLSEIIPMGDCNSGLTFYYRIREPVYHSLIITSDFFVFHEAVEGPFDRSKTIFAPWSPGDDNHEKVKAFINSLKSCLEIKES